MEKTNKKQAESGKAVQSKTPTFADLFDKVLMDIGAKVLDKSKAKGK